MRLRQTYRAVHCLSRQVGRTQLPSSFLLTEAVQRGADQEQHSLAHSFNASEFPKLTIGLTARSATNGWGMCSDSSSTDYMQIR